MFARGVEKGKKGCVFDLNPFVLATAFGVCAWVFFVDGSKELRDNNNRPAKTSAKTTVAVVECADRSYFEGGCLLLELLESESAEDCWDLGLLLLRFLIEEVMMWLS
mmetsp:Transcript_362/g.750  ORF Transcript_362/g.750 Transcript_362/m.750 type:complete len:107 (+) Transcript_362:175-495(+)